MQAGAPACVTVNTCPPTVIEPERAVAPGFDAHDTVSVALPLPLAGLADSHDESEAADQVHEEALALSATDPLQALDGADADEDDRAYEQDEPPPNPSVTEPLLTRASWPASSYVSNTNTRSEVVPAGIENGAPPYRFVDELPVPEKLPGLLLADGRTDSDRLGSAGTSTRITRSLRQLWPSASKLIVYPSDDKVVAPAGTGTSTEELPDEDNSPYVAHPAMFVDAELDPA